MKARQRKCAGPPTHTHTHTASQTSLLEYNARPTLHTLHYTHTLAYLRTVLNKYMSTRFSNERTTMVMMVMTATTNCAYVFQCARQQQHNEVCRAVTFVNAQRMASTTTTTTAASPPPTHSSLSPIQVVSSTARWSIYTVCVRACVCMLRECVNNKNKLQ